MVSILSVSNSSKYVYRTLHISAHDQVSQASHSNLQITNNDFNLQNNQFQTTDFPETTQSSTDTIEINYFDYLNQLLWFNNLMTEIL